MWPPCCGWGTRRIPCFRKNSKVCQSNIQLLNLFLISGRFLSLGRVIFPEVGQITTIATTGATTAAIDGILHFSHEFPDSKKDGNGYYNKDNDFLNIHKLKK